MSAGKHIYLSYCREDSDEVSRLRDDLIFAGESVWWDHDILPGQDWRFALRLAVQESYAVLFCFSERWHDRPHTSMGTEIEATLEELRRRAPEEVFLIPVRLSETSIPPIQIDEERTLDHLQFVDLFPPERRSASLRRLLAAVRASPGRLQLPKLKVPQELLDACLHEDCVLYAGAGLSAPSGFPMWKELVERLLEWAAESRYIDRGFKESLGSALDQGSVDRVADSIVSKAREQGGPDALRPFLESVFGERRPQLTPLHELLRRLRPAAALTTNFDYLLERAFETQPPAPVLTPGDLEPLRTALSKREFFILKLYGDLVRSPDSILVAPIQYEETIRGNRSFADFMQQLFFSRTLLFLGASLRGIDAYLRGLGFPQIPGRRHYAVVAVTASAWEAEAEVLDRRYGIEVLPYLATEGHPEVLDFIRGVVVQVEARDGTRRRAKFARERQRIEPIRLQSLEVMNIGAFEHLQVDFDPGWTVLLGDNGVGKSTVLKAIALAIAGKDSEVVAKRLLRRVGNVQSGEIKLMMSNGDLFKTVISLNSLDVAEVISYPTRPFEWESFLVLGFPAIRTIGAPQSKGPQLLEGRERPTPDDVLPLLSTAPDPRILDFKQWVINRDYQSRKSGEPSDALLLDFFETMEGLLEGLDVRLDQIREDDVFVRSADGDLPVDLLSQGTVSIFGWVAVLMQRLFEMKQPRTGPALVLIDEIDAHMHPEWQQAIASRLKGRFPEVQFIVTSHSPFLAVGRQASELIRLRRESPSGRVVAETADYDTTKMGVANVLTSHLFGLESPLDGAVQERLFRKRELSVKPELNEDEEAELERLSEELGNLDSTAMIRDPLYRLFAREMLALQQDRPEALTKEQEIKQGRSARRILQELRDKEKNL